MRGWLKKERKKKWGKDERRGFYSGKAFQYSDCRYSDCRYSDRLIWFCNACLPRRRITVTLIPKQKMRD
jgi:hypothetical protein